MCKEHILYKKYLDFVTRKRPIEAYDSNSLHVHSNLLSTDTWEYHGNSIGL